MQKRSHMKKESEEVVKAAAKLYKKYYKTV